MMITAPRRESPEAWMREVVTVEPGVTPLAGTAPVSTLKRAAWQPGRTSAITRQQTTNMINLDNLSFIKKHSHNNYYHNIPARCSTSSAT